MEHQLDIQIGFDPFCRTTYSRSTHVPCTPACCMLLDGSWYITSACHRGHLGPVLLLHTSCVQHTRQHNIQVCRERVEYRHRHTTQCIMDLHVLCCGSAGRCHTAVKPAGMRARCKAAEGHLQHLQSASDSVLAELERTRQAVTCSVQSHVLEDAAGRLVLAVISIKLIPD